MYKLFSITTALPSIKFRFHLRRLKILFQFNPNQDGIFGKKTTHTESFLEAKAAFSPQLHKKLTKLNKTTFDNDAGQPQTPYISGLNGADLMEQHVVEGSGGKADR
jgi:hypothetical protein